jgi:hypothetical protein
MKCRLEDEAYCDKNFQIEFDTVKQIEELRDSLTHMIKYVKMCQVDNVELPPLIYRITELESSKIK